MLLAAKKKGASCTSEGGQLSRNFSISPRIKILTVEGWTQLGVQQDNDPKHTTKLVLEWIKLANINILKTSQNSTLGGL